MKKILITLFVIIGLTITLIVIQKKIIRIKDGASTSNSSLCCSGTSIPSPDNNKTCVPKLSPGVEY